MNLIRPPASPEHFHLVFISRVHCTYYIHVCVCHVYPGPSPFGLNYLALDIFYFLKSDNVKLNMTSDDHKWVVSILFMHKIFE